MPDIASSLLTFILDLLRDPAAAQAFADDPHQALADAGLTGVDAADVAALEPAVAEHVPALATTSAGGHASHAGRSAGESHAVAAAPVATTAEPTSAVEQLQTLQATYSFTDHSVSYDYSHDVWAVGDVYQVAGNGNVIGDSNATGSNSATHDVRDQSDNSVTTVTVGDIASGNDSSDNSVDSSDHSVDASTTVHDSFNGNDLSDSSDHSVDNSDNSVDSSDNSVDSSDHSDHSDNSVDSSDHSDNSVWTDESDNSVDSSDNSDNSINDSFDDNDLSDNSVDDSVHDNDLSDNSDNSVTEHAAV